MLSKRQCKNSQKPSEGSQPSWDSLSSTSFAEPGGQRALLLHKLIEVTGLWIRQRNSGRKWDMAADDTRLNSSAGMTAPFPAWTHNACVHKQNKNAYIITHSLHCRVSCQHNSSHNLLSDWTRKMYILVGVTPWLPTSNDTHSHTDTFSWHFKNCWQCIWFHTHCPPANLTWNLFSGLRIWTYSGQFGAKSFTAQARRIVWWSWDNHRQRQK